MQETRVQSLGWEDPLEEEVATHSSILAWRIPFLLLPEFCLAAYGLPRVGHGLATKQQQNYPACLPQSEVKTHFLQSTSDDALNFLVVLFCFSFIRIILNLQTNSGRADIFICKGSHGHTLNHNCLFLLVSRIIIASQ